MYVCVHCQDCGSANLVLTVFATDRLIIMHVAAATQLLGNRMECGHRVSFSPSTLCCALLIASTFARGLGLQQKHPHLPTSRFAGCRFVQGLSAIRYFVRNSVFQPHSKRAHVSCCTVLVPHRYGLTFKIRMPETVDYTHGRTNYVCQLRIAPKSISDKVARMYSSPQVRACCVQHCDTGHYRPRLAALQARTVLPAMTMHDRGCT